MRNSGFPPRSQQVTQTSSPFGYFTSGCSDLALAIGTHIQQSCDALSDYSACFFNLCAGIHSGKRNSKRASCLVCAQSNGSQHMARRIFSAVTGRPSRDTHPCSICHQNQRLSINAMHSDTQSFGRRSGTTIQCPDTTNTILTKMGSKTIQESAL